MDSSLPVLVSRLPDRGALARLVRAALRHEIAHVELASGPQRGDPHTLDLHVPGEAPLALLAEPAGAGQNGIYPLRLRPLYRLQATQLHALLAAENLSVDGPADPAPDTSPLPPANTPSGGDAAARGPLPTKTLSLADEAAAARALVRRSQQAKHAADAEPPSSSPLLRTAGAGVRPQIVAIARGGPTRSPPSSPARPQPGPADPRRTAPGGWSSPSGDPRRTAPSASWGPAAAASIAASHSHAQVPSVIVAPGIETEHGGDAGADADDASFSVSVDFEHDEANGPSAADLEEPSLSVSVVFEPDALPPGILAGLPSPLGDDTQDMPGEPGVTIDRAPTDAPRGGGFFDDVFSNFPSMTLPEEGTGGSATRTHAPLVPGHDRLPSIEEYVDEDATLIRLPAGAIAAEEEDERPRQPSEPVVRPESRSSREHTPTAVTEIGLAVGMATEVSPQPSEDDDEEPPAPTRAEDRHDVGDDDETASLGRAPVALVTAASVDPALGRRIAEGKYVIESLIGSGAAGAVYRAVHRELRRTVAIKLLHPHYQKDPHFMTSFRGEALAASQLDHPNVMRVLDFGQEPDGLVYIVMEFLSGRTLQNLLDEERRLPTERAVEVMIQVCAALSVAHDHGIIHRDIKPDNIMLVPSRNDEGTTFELVKVCDFGIAALQNPRAEDKDLAAKEHIIAGTPEYMSPEQARGREVDARSDVYACGICLYELVTGRPPFLGNNAAEILIKQIEEIPAPPSKIVKGLDPIIEEVILRAVQKDPQKRHQSAREMRVELKELIEPGEGYQRDDEDELSIVADLPVLDDPASGFPGFFIAFSSAVLRFGRFERGHTEVAQAMKELQDQMRIALRGRTELTFARRDVQQTVGFVVMSGTAEIVELRRLLGSQLMGSFGDPFVAELVKKGIVSLTLREGIPDLELQYLVEMMLGPFAHEELRKELLSKPLRNISLLFVADVVGRDRQLSWKVGLCASRLARDLRALCNVRGISLKKMRETRDELIGGVARLLTRGDEVKQFLYNGDLVDDAVANLRGFSSFKVAPLVVDRVLHESCAETATILLHDLDASDAEEQERLRPFLALFAQRLVTERSPRSDAAVAELYRRKLIGEDEMPRDLKESMRAATLADALVREPSQFLLTLDLIGDPETYARELSTLEAAMTTLARRSEAVALAAVMSTLARHAQGGDPTARDPRARENAALRTMKSMIDKQRLMPIATALLVGPVHQREAARQLIIIAGSVGASALYSARESTIDPGARGIFVKVLKDTGAAGWALLAQVLPRLELKDDAELALAEDLLRAMPEHPDPVLGEAVSKFLAHPLLRPAALTALVPLWGERAKKPLVDALEYADDKARILALGELRRLQGIDEYVFSVVERFLTTKGSAGEELRVAAAAALADVAMSIRPRAVQLLVKAVLGKRGLVAMLRGSDATDDSPAVVEAMGRALLGLDRAEGHKALKSRLARADGPTKQRLAALLQSAG